MKTLLDIEKWPRKDHFNFFSKFDEPFFGIVVEVDCTFAYNFCKQNNRSLFIHYLHKSLAAANMIEPFRYQVEDGKIYINDHVHASPTIARDNGNFGFSYMTFSNDFKKFESHAKEVINLIQGSNALMPKQEPIPNVIHYSVLPKIFFTSLSHARSFSINDTCPKISFGKLIDRDGKKIMPMSVHVHHALMDGYHVGQYVELFQIYLNKE